MIRLLLWWSSSCTCIDYSFSHTFTSSLLQKRNFLRLLLLLVWEFFLGFFKLASERRGGRIKKKKVKMSHYAWLIENTFAQIDLFRKLSVALLTQLVWSFTEDWRRTSECCTWANELLLRRWNCKSRGRREERDGENNFHSSLTTFTFRSNVQIHSVSVSSIAPAPSFSSSFSDSLSFLLYPIVE